MQSNGGFGAAVAIGSDYSFPAINGQTNRSDFFLMDGLYDYGAIESTYAIAPIIDAIQEFKVVSHTDDAEFGSVLGGVVNVVTKTGTNNLHGSAWEYLRNTVFDARNYFLPTDASQGCLPSEPVWRLDRRPCPDSEAIQRQEQDLLLWRLSGFPILTASEYESAGAYCGGVGRQRGRQSPTTNLQSLCHYGSRQRLLPSSHFPAIRFPRPLLTPEWSLTQSLSSLRQAPFSAPPTAMVRSRPTPSTPPR